MYYDVFEAHPIFAGVTELGDDFGRNGALTAAPPSTAVAWNGAHEIMAERLLYDDAPPGACLSLALSEHALIRQLIDRG